MTMPALRAAKAGQAEEGTAGMTMNKRYDFTPARQIDGWWWSFVRDADTGKTVTECRASVSSSAERDAKEWIRMAMEDAA